MTVANSFPPGAPSGNWWLYHRWVDGVAVDFAEVLVVNNQTLLRKGKALTWGTSASVNELDLNNTFSQLVADGYTCSRQWCFDPMVFDHQRFIHELIVAAREHFVSLRKRRPGLNAFSLQTDDCAMCIAAIAHPFEDLDGADDNILLNPSEWEVGDDDSSIFDVPYRLMLAHHRDEFSQVAFESYCRTAIESIVVVLEALRDQGVFGDPNDCIVLCSVTDGSWNEAHVARLNSPKWHARLKV